jgi:hypothetical protein
LTPDTRKSQALCDLFIWRSRQALRKSIQKEFARSGYQSVCSKMHPTTLSGLDAMETTCVITENGRHVLSQTLVGAVDTDKAYVFSYAGQAEAYEASRGEVSSVRDSLKL